MKIKTVEIHNFKEVENLVLEVEHLNVLIGPCGHGKSSVLNAILFALTGQGKETDIGNKGKQASILITLEDDSTFERTRKFGGTEVKCNGKKTTQKSLNEYLKEKLGVDISLYKPMTCVNFFSGLDQKGLTDLFLSILPLKINFPKMCDLISDLTCRQLDDDLINLLWKEFPGYQENIFYRDLYDEEGQLRNDIEIPSFGLDEIEKAYKRFFELRRIEKSKLTDLRAKASFDKAQLPKETKEELEKSLYEIATKEGQQAESQRHMADYNRRMEARKDAERRLEKLKEELKSYESVQKPDTDAFKQAEQHKAQFEAAIKKRSGYIAIFESNIALFQKTLDSLSKPVCPISNKLICTTDKSVIRQDMELGLTENRKAKEEAEAFIKRCQEQIDMRDKIIDVYNKGIVLWTKKAGLEKQIKEFVLPEIGEKPEDHPSIDYSQEKAEWNRKLQIYAAYENARRVEEDLKKQEHLVDLLEFAVRVLDVKTGVRSLILKKALKSFNALCNEKARQFLDGFSILFECEEEFQVMIKPGKDKPWVSMWETSTGEFTFVCYLLTKIINAAAGARFLIIDNLNELDPEFLKRLAELLKKDNEYENIFVSTVNTADAIRLFTEMDDVNIIQM
uniref:AAA family ATPase n=1 Tax=Lachnoclostridium phocaeense TaxID=1871021 RepID=UPI0026DD31AE|nr:DUF2813 domain-containing protein [Lachnoclostridium phocaeense]